MEQDPFSPLRQMMVQIVAAHVEATHEVTGVRKIDSNILEAMESVPRHEFVPVELRAYAHADGPLPIGSDKTISQPFITALMTGLLNLNKSDTILEIGTGLGYHTALLSQLVEKVYTVEIIEELANEAEARLKKSNCRNVEYKLGNGYHGWPEHAPFDKILVASAPELIPPSLLQQLKPNGRMVIPAGLGEDQKLMVVSKDSAGRISSEEILAVRFAPMEGVELLQ